VTTEVLDKRESNSRSDSGIVFFRHRGINQRDEVVCDCRRAGLLLRRSAASATAG
jgi:acyl dehydratase